MHQVSGYEKEIKKQEEQKNKIRERYKGVDRNELEFIPAKPREKLFEDTAEKRVCAYCRVSTDDVNQTSSYELQKNHYEDMIKEHQGWELVGIYADEGISGTSLQHRDEFNRMIEDCKAGKIDLIVTKSVSRFARNIVDCIAKVRELGNMRPKVGVFFETEHIYTLDNTSEMMLAVLSAAAQEESHTKSEIMNISIEQRFSRGIFLTPKLLGYDVDEDGNLVINKEEAETVRLCYYLFLNGFPTAEIAEILMQLKRKTKLGNTKWSSGTVGSLLRNERYCGDVLSRKTFTPNYLDHKSKKNRHDRNQYRQTDHHEAIVDRDIYNAAQKMLTVTKYAKKGFPFPNLKVVDGGALKGFVSVNRSWTGFTVEDYKKASQSVYSDQSNKRMVVRKCEENDKDALRWCIEKPDKRKSRKMSNKLFSAMMYDMMGWNTDCRYKILGHKITHEDETMYIFDLLETEIFMDTKRKKKANPDSLEKKEELVTAETDQTPEQNQEEIAAKVARKLNRIPFYPKDWKDSFGLSVEEHKKALETNLTDGYIEFSATR